MVNPETHASAPEGNADRVHSSVRVFAVAPIREEQLDALFEKDESPNNFPLVEIILVKKSDSGLVTALGGELSPSDDIFHAGMQKVFEKSLLTRESLGQFKNSAGSGEAIGYTVTGDQRPRKAFLEVMRVRSASMSLHEPREINGAVDKIEQLVSVSPEELRDLFKHGSVTTRHGEQFHIYGHLTQAETGDVSLASKDRRVQQREFGRILDDIFVYEQTIRVQMREHINRVRRWYHKPLISSLGECGRDEVKRAFLVAQMTMGFADERARDAVGGTMPPVSADLPMASLFIREITPGELPDALISSPTREVRRVRNILHYALRGAVNELYDRMGKDISVFTSTRGVDSIAALYAIWPDVVALQPDKLTDMLLILDARFVEEMAHRLNKSTDVVRRALKMPDRLSRYLADELAPSHERFQLDHPTNEAASAIERPFIQTLHILGLHPYIPVSPEFNNDAVKRTRGEILMQKAVVFSAIPVMERNDRSDNSIFEIGLARFLEYPPQLDELILQRTPHTIFSRSTKNAVGDKKLDLWYEKRPLKSEERMLLKSFQEADIYDDYSVNLVIRDKNYSEAQRNDIPLRLSMVNVLREALFTHFKTELAGSGWKVDIIPGTYKKKVLDSVQSYMNVPLEEKQKFIDGRNGGKRAGSVGNLIVREKFIIRFTKGDRVQFCEVSIYPFEQIEGTGLPLAGSGFIGFTEKIMDDMNGRYAGERLYKTSPDDPTAPSLLELYEPPTWSKSRFDLIRFLQHTPKKKK